jgi:tetratricopeptide (TPR) repeat protein
LLNIQYTDRPTLLGDFCTNMDDVHYQSIHTEDPRFVQELKEEERIRPHSLTGLSPLFYALGNNYQQFRAYVETGNSLAPHPQWGNVIDILLTMRFPEENHALFLGYLYHKANHPIFKTWEPHGITELNLGAALGHTEVLLQAVKDQSNHFNVLNPDTFSTPLFYIACSGNRERALKELTIAFSDHHQQTIIQREFEKAEPFYEFAKAMRHSPANITIHMKRTYGKWKNKPLFHPRHLMLFVEMHLSLAYNYILKEAWELAAQSFEEAIALFAKAPESDLYRRLQIFIYHQQYKLLKDHGLQLKDAKIKNKTLKDLLDQEIKLGSNIIEKNRRERDILILAERHLSRGNELAHEHGLSDSQIGEIEAHFSNSIAVLKTIPFKLNVYWTLQYQSYVEFAKTQRFLCKWEFVHQHLCNAVIAFVRSNDSTDLKRLASFHVEIDEACLQKRRNT